MTATAAKLRNARRHMTEIVFYRLKGQTLEQVLPGLLQDSLTAAGVWWCRARRKSASRHSTPICGPGATIPFCRTGPGATRKQPASQSCLLHMTAIPTRRRYGSLSKARRCRPTGDLRAGRAGIRRRRSRCRRDGSNPLDRGQIRRLRGPAPPGGGKKPPAAGDLKRQGDATGPKRVVTM